ncbi:hypothetical protein [Streptomyces sp. PAM3C]|uniref:hypothetical protein n=1 Tax=Streptomyces sp. PAM3C TaxID=2847300 RepID=UPI001C1E40D1|nr:hypothetical protein [Streptomyces sp. PAM3C]MBU5946181.1 hypothetical protein [Streptomyces sp. PAM3C]
MARVAALLRAAVVLPGPVLERPRTGTLRATFLRTGTLRTTFLRTGTLRTTFLRTGTLRTTFLRTGTLRATFLRTGTLRLPGPLGQSGLLRRPLTILRLPRPLPRPLPGALRLPLLLRRPLTLTLALPLRQPRPLLLPGSALRLARATVRVAGAAGPLLLARAVLRRPGTDGARQRLADLELGPLGHLADLGHDVTALAHEFVVDREAVGGGGGGSHGSFLRGGDLVHRGRSPAPDVQRRRTVTALHSAAFCPGKRELS